MKKFLKKIKKYYIKKQNVNLNIPLYKENDVFFCFAGEFGYEMISWIPYLLFLKKNGVKINTIGRLGSKVFYYFSDKHLELQPQEITGMWGDRENYRKIQYRLGIKTMVYPDNKNKDKMILINGHEWLNKDIHDEIKELNYEKLNLSNISERLPFGHSKKYVVINNKYATFTDNKHTQGWKKTSMNFFDAKSLVSLKESLLKCGYFVVYNKFFENTLIDREMNLDDTGIFEGENCYDMRTYYRKHLDPLVRNKIQISLYNKSEFVVGVQGGNIYLPAICGKNILMLMREGDYIDYTEISKIFGVKVDVFYEPKHLICWYENNYKK